MALLYQLYFAPPTHTQTSSTLFSSLLWSTGICSVTPECKGSNRDGAYLSAKIEEAHPRLCIRLHTYRYSTHSE